MFNDNHHSLDFHDLNIELDIHEHRRDYLEQCWNMLQSGILGLFKLKDIVILAADRFILTYITTPLLGVGDVIVAFSCGATCFKLKMCEAAVSQCVQSLSVNIPHQRCAAIHVTKGMCKL